MSQLLAFTETLSAKELRSVKPGRVLNTAIKVTIAAAANLPPRYEIGLFLLFYFLFRTSLKVLTSSFLVFLKQLWWIAMLTKAVSVVC